MSDAAPVKEGDQVSWAWSGGQPGGVASEVKADEVKMETKRGNTVTKKGDEENPAVRVERSGHDVVKKASELEIEEEGPNHKADGGEKKGGLEVPKGGKGRSKSRSKSPQPKKSAEPEKKEDKAEERKSAEPKKFAEPEKKEAATNGEEKKEKAKPGRKPGSKAASGAATKKKDDKPKKRAATETGEPRRSKRNKA